MSRRFPTVPIGETVSRVSTCDPSTELAGGVFEYIDISLVNRETKRIEGCNKIAAEDAPSRARQMVKASDILVSTVRPNLNAVAQVPDPLDGAIASTGFTVLRPKQAVINARYLFQWVKSPQFVARMVKSATGASYPAVTDRIVKESLIPLPPLDEQRRIAAVLDKADALREKRLQALKKLDTLLQALFLNLFGDPVTNPKSWKVEKLGQFASFVGGGTPSRANPNFYEGDICWATSKDMKGEILQDTQEHITQEAIEQSATKLVPAGTILVVVKSKILLRHLPVLISAVPTCFGQDLKGIVLHDPSLTNYIARHLRIGQRSLLERARGVNTEGLTLEHLSNYKVMLPPKEIIEEFSSIEMKLRGMRVKMGASEGRANDLFHSLQQRAFSGELFNGKATATGLPQKTMKTLQPGLFE